MVTLKVASIRRYPIHIVYFLLELNFLQQKCYNELIMMEWSGNESSPE